LAVIEDLIQGKDNQVRRAKVRVISKGKVVCLNRPVQMLYPLKVGESLSESPQNRQSREEQEEGV